MGVGWETWQGRAIALIGVCLVGLGIFLMVGIGSDQVCASELSPSAEFEFDEQRTGENVTVTVSHRGGDDIPPSKVLVIPERDLDSQRLPAANETTLSAYSWARHNGTTEPDAAVANGSSVTLTNVSSGTVLTVFYWDHEADDTSECAGVTSTLLAHHGVSVPGPGPAATATRTEQQ